MPTLSCESRARWTDGGSLTINENASSSPPVAET
jgi:hypothetical protein